VARAVLDPNVLIAALISPRGAPAALYLALSRGDFELVASPLLLGELDRVLARAKFRRYASVEEAQLFVGAVARLAVLKEDPPAVARFTVDPADDYVVALARAAGVDAIVSGDRHLLELEDQRPPVLTPRAFLNQLAVASGPS
jgi:putative PIN family toxin of toxin-antitoxin system